MHIDYPYFKKNHTGNAKLKRTFTTFNPSTPEIHELILFLFYVDLYF